MDVRKNIIDKLKTIVQSTPHIGSIASLKAEEYRAKFLQHSWIKKSLGLYADPYAILNIRISLRPIGAPCALMAVSKN